MFAFASARMPRVAHTQRWPKKMEKHHLTLESVCSSFRLEATPRRLISIRQIQKCPKVNRKSAGWPE